MIFFFLIYGFSIFYGDLSCVGVICAMACNVCIVLLLTRA